MNQKEKIFGFIYVLIFFLTLTFFSCWFLFFSNPNIRFFNQKEFAISKMNFIKEYQQDQAKYLPIVDSLNKKIEKFDPGVNAIYEENDIYYMINSLKNVYEIRSWDSRYKSFLQVADFYGMWFVDKKELWNKRQNIQRFKKNLEECEIGLTNKKNEMNSNMKR